MRSSGPRRFRERAARPFLHNTSPTWGDHVLHQFYTPTGYGGPSREYSRVRAGPPASAAAGTPAAPGGEAERSGVCVLRTAGKFYFLVICIQLRSPEEKKSTWAVTNFAS
jgi:hypothetical protein